MRAILTLSIILFSVISVAHSQVAGKLAIGDPIPDELGIGLDGKKVKASDHLGKILVISFWATWCPPCQKELPIIDNLQRLAGKERLSVFAVNFGEKSRIYKKFVGRLGEVNLTFTHDSRGRIGEKTYGIKGIPHMVIVDHNGNIVNVHSGYGDETVNNLASEINTLLRIQASGI